MNHSAKILFLDLDGTLLNDRKEITAGNREAIRRALAQGHKIVISSGRPTKSVVNLARKLDLTDMGCYAITFNGACIYDFHQEKDICRRTLPIPVVRRVLAEAGRRGIYAHTYDADGIVAEHPGPELDNYVATIQIPFRIVEHTCSVLVREPEKVIIIHPHDHQALLDFQQSLTAWGAGQLDSFFSHPTYLEVVAPGVSKGSAVQILCDRLNIPMENTISAGDAENDISMIRVTHIGAVMKNADPSMYQSGNYITENDNNHDAIAEIIEKFMLN